VAFSEFKVSWKSEDEAQTRVRARYYDGEFETVEGVETWVRASKLAEHMFTFPPGTTDEDIDVTLAAYAGQVSDLDLIPIQAEIVDG